MTAEPTVTTVTVERDSPQPQHEEDELRVEGTRREGADGDRRQ